MVLYFSVKALSSFGILLTEKNIVQKLSIAGVDAKISFENINGHKKITTRWIPHSI